MNRRHRYGQQPTDRQQACVGWARATTDGVRNRLCVPRTNQASFTAPLAGVWGTKVIAGPKLLGYLTTRRDAGVVETFYPEMVLFPMICDLIINVQVSVSVATLRNTATSQEQAHRQTWSPRRPDAALWWWPAPRVDRGVDRSLKSTTTHQTHLPWTAAPAPNPRKPNPSPSQPTSYGPDFHWVSNSSKPLPYLL